MKFLEMVVVFVVVIVVSVVVVVVVVVFVVVVDMALTHRLTNGPTERQTGSNSATRPGKIPPYIDNMTSPGRTEFDEALSCFGNVLGVKDPFFDG